MSMFRREITWVPGFDYRNDPDKSKYGCHGLNLRWLLHGPKATIQFLVYTGWLPTWDPYSKDDRIASVHPLPADLGYHADESVYEGDTKREGCDVRPNGCYYDGSGLQAYDVFKLLVSQGEEAVWKRMEEEYHSRFSDNQTTENTDE